MRIEEATKNDLRCMAAEGATVSEILRYIRKATCTEGSGEGRGVVIAYMKATFGIPLREAASLGAWTGFSDGDGELSDADLDQLLGAFVRPGGLATMESPPLAQGNRPPRPQ